MIDFAFGCVLFVIFGTILAFVLWAFGVLRDIARVSEEVERER